MPKKDKRLPTVLIGVNYSGEDVFVEMKTSEGDPENAMITLIMGLVSVCTEMGMDRDEFMRYVAQTLRGMLDKSDRSGTVTPLVRDDPKKIEVMTFAPEHVKCDICEDPIIDPTEDYTDGKGGRFHASCFHERAKVKIVGTCTICKQPVYENDSYQIQDSFRGKERCHNKCGKLLPP